jgi:hypothetical protein
MYSITTQFIKGQIPGVTSFDLINRYIQELEDQNIDQYIREFDTVNFTNSISVANAVLNNYGNRFSNFSVGKIRIIDNDFDFTVLLEADLTRLFLMPSVFSGLATLLLLMTSEFSAFVIVFGLVIFLGISILRYILFVLSFPVYFTKLRNDIEREFQTN